MAGACAFDGCGKDAPERLRSELSGASVAYCPRHAAMARDGFRHVQTPRMGDWLARSGSNERWYWLGGILVSEDGTRTR